MSKTIKLARGEAVISEVVTYGLQKKMSRALFAGRELNMQTGIGTTTYEAIDESQNIGILGLLEKLVIDNMECELNQETLESLHADEYKAISEAVTKVLNPPDLAKKNVS